MGPSLLLGIVFSSLSIATAFLPPTIPNVRRNLNESDPSACPPPDFPWKTIPPAKELIWHPCYPSGVFQCARLSVPLDYSQPGERQATIALIRIPSTFPVDSPSYKGPVLFNPGGPGGSGVDTILSIGSYLSGVIGPEFDLVSFDPRGVARSTPRADFFDTATERLFFDSSISSSDIGIAREWAQYTLLGQIAAKRDDGFLEHINTANTATDMLTIVQAYGKEKLQYWGISYGTILGATFAAMYPDKVERLAIDGVMDLEDYYATEWLTSHADTGKALNIFFENCVEAGPDLCPFYAPTTEDMNRNLTALYDSLRKQPIPVYTGTPYLDGVIDDKLVRGVLFAFLYAPSSFPVIAQALKLLAAGDDSGLAEILAARFQPPDQCNCEPNEFAVVREALTTVACNDGDEVPPSLDETKKYMQRLEETTKWADIWTEFRLKCVAWPNGKKGFRGPFIGNTSHPLLVVGNTADPVTPLQSAKKVAKGFKDAVVLTIDSAGHASVNAPSVCAEGYIRQYFQDGTLPPPDTVCQPNIKNPFLEAPAPASGGSNQTPRRGASFDAVSRKA